MRPDDTVVVIGGTSGIGLAVARRCLDDGARVIIAGRSPDRLDAARTELGAPQRLRAIATDIADRAALGEFFEQVTTLRHLVVTAADLPYGPADAVTEDDMMRAVRSKITGPFFAAQFAARRISPPGSITLTAGIAAHRPIPGGSLGAIVNGALESMVRTLALEFAPIRVNAVSPGWVDTPIWGQLVSPEVKRARLAEMSARLPAGRIATSDDIAHAVGFLIDDAFITGTVLHADGAQQLV